MSGTRSVRLTGLWLKATGQPPKLPEMLIAPQTISSDNTHGLLLHQSVNADACLFSITTAGFSVPNSLITSYLPLQDSIFTPITPLKIGPVHYATMEKMRLNTCVSAHIPKMDGLSYYRNSPKWSPNSCCSMN